MLNQSLSRDRQFGGAGFVVISLGETDAERDRESRRVVNHITRSNGAIRTYKDAYLFSRGGFLNEEIAVAVMKEYV